MASLAVEKAMALGAKDEAMLAERPTENVAAYDLYLKAQARVDWGSRSDAAALRDALERAAACWREPQRWRRIQANGMARSFGWDASARQYLALYERALAPG